jgi:hypothetical protein
VAPVRVSDPNLHCEDATTISGMIAKYQSELRRRSASRPFLSDTSSLRGPVSRGRLSREAATDRHRSPARGRRPRCHQHRNVMRLNLDLGPVARWRFLSQDRGSRKRMGQ